MGKFSATQNNVYQQISGELAGAEYGKPSYFNNTVYYGAAGDSIKAFPISSGKLAITPASITAIQFPFPGATPTISANGTNNGILWAVENGMLGVTPGVLHAYDATNLTIEFYNSNQASGGRDQFSGNKFITAMIANGKVFVGTPNSVAVFGLL
jgi:outer membrane protein assembly factor BamB